jgi:hypothetical protein
MMQVGACPSSVSISEAFYHGPITGFVYPMIVCRIESRECITIGIGPSRKLDE